MIKFDLMYTIRLCSSDKKKLKEASKISGIPMAEIIREGMISRIEYIKKKFRPQNVGPSGKEKK